MYKTKRISIVLLLSMALLSFLSYAALAIETEDPIRHPSFDTPMFYTESVEECVVFIERENIPNGFPGPGELGFLGYFNSFHCDYPYYVNFQATYRLLDKNGYCLWVEVQYHDHDYSGYGHPELDLKLLDDLRSISGSVYEESDNSFEYTSLEYKGMTLGYDADSGCLKYIEFYNAPWLYCIEIDEKYPQNGKNTWLMRFLNPETTDAMIDELHAHLDGTYNESVWFTSPLALVSIGAIGGAVVAAVTAWLITYFVMRKKAKNPPRLGTNGEIPAFAAAETASDGITTTSDQGDTASPKEDSVPPTDTAPDEQAPTRGDSPTA